MIGSIVQLQPTVTFRTNAKDCRHEEIFAEPVAANNPVTPTILSEIALLYALPLQSNLVGKMNS